MLKGYFSVSTNVPIAGQNALVEKGLIEKHHATIRLLLEGSLYLMTPSKAKRLDLVLNKSWVKVERGDVLPIFQVFAAGSKYIFIHQLFWLTIMDALARGGVITEEEVLSVIDEMASSDDENVPDELNRLHRLSIRNLKTTSRFMTKEEKISMAMTRTMMKPPAPEITARLSADGTPVFTGMQLSDEDKEEITEAIKAELGDKGAEAEDQTQEGN